MPIPPKPGKRIPPKGGSSTAPPKRPPAVNADPRVVELASCVAFALKAFRNRPVFDSGRRKMEGWHTWFRRALTEAGYVAGKDFPADENEGKK